MTQLVDYLEQSNIVSSHQFGFRKGRSTEDQRIVTYADVADRVGAGFVVDLALFGFSKAFDLVSHDILLTKLCDLGVYPVLVGLVHCFLLGRSMRVVVDGVASCSRDVRSGVPQGSVLGSVLFLVYINHVTDGVGASYKAFADDCKLYLRYKRECTLAIAGVSSLQSDLERISLVSSFWNFKLNTDKCVEMRFSRGFKQWNENIFCLGIISMVLVWSLCTLTETWVF